MSRFRTILEENLRGIAEIFFVRSWRPGVAVWIVLTALYPDRALTGTAAMMLAAGLHAIFRAQIEERYRPWIGLNAFLTGLGFASLYGAPLSVELLAHFIAAIFVQQIIYYALITILGARVRVPVLTVPFILVVRIMVALWPATSPATSGIGATLNLSVEQFLPEYLALFFRSLGALLFVRDVIVGICISGVILYYSRILFSVAVVGFIPVALMRSTFPVDQRPEIIAFNVIVTMMMIGAVHEVPSRWSYRNAALFGVLAMIVAIGFSLWSPPVLNLPFVLATYAYLFVKPVLGAEGALPFDFTPGTPEQNLYYAYNRRERYTGVALAPFALPFNGEWKVTQGHDGEFTHKDKWNHAWDFERVDAADKFTDGRTPHLSSFYSYKQPVCAALEGEVANIQNHIPDNEPGTFNFRQNWGNTVVLRHRNGLCTAYSHLTTIPETIVIGRWLNRGEVLGYCGNSGRSDRPHIHFQFQSTPRIGDHTVPAVIKRYLVRGGAGTQLRIAEYPRTGERVSNLETSPRVTAAFTYPYGKELLATGEVGGKFVAEKWISTVDFYNHTYVYCAETGASAFFFSEEGVFYFSDFFGPTHSLLGLFALAASRIVFTGTGGVQYDDQLPLNRVGRGITNALVDMLSPIARVREVRAAFAVEESADRAIVFRNVITDVSRFPAHRERTIASFECALPYGVRTVRVHGALNDVSCSFTVSY